VTSVAPSGPEWHRLHPLTPIVRAGGVAVALLAVLAGSASASSASGAHRDTQLPLFDLALLGVVVLLSIVRWLVTRWRLDGVTLRIETGLFKRDSRQLPLARIQAVDVVRPFLARVLGLAELRIRLAGAGSSDGRLAYLSEPVALDLRARLLAGHHGLDLATPEPAERPVVTVPTGRLVAAALLSSSMIATLAFIAAIVALTHVSKAAAAGVGGTAFVYLLGTARTTWRRVSDQYGFSVGEAGDGIRIRRGLLATVAETIPVRRVQAVREIEPFLWRPLKWCRLEVDIAGSPGREQGTRSASVTRSLLPVGPRDDAIALIGRLLLMTNPGLSRPPRRVAWKAPFSYHFLSAGHDDSLAVATTGRLRKQTTWVPLEKVQSIRRIQGPLQRALGVATIHLDAAGRRVEAVFKDRDTDEADRLFDDLTVLSRAARKRAEARPAALSASHPERTASEVAAGATQPSVEPARAVPAAHPAPPPGWYPDPSGQHQYRWWDGNSWTSQVSDDGATSADHL
jgi:putative membrane protein